MTPAHSDRLGFASADAPTVYGWYDECKKDWSVDTHKPIDAWPWTAKVGNWRVLSTA